MRARFRRGETWRETCRALRALHSDQEREQLLRLQTATLDEDALRRALADFDGLWVELIPRERNRLLSLLVAQVRYRGATGDIEIDLRTTGLGAIDRGAA